MVQALTPDTVLAGGGCVARRSDDGGQTFRRIAFTNVESACREQLVDLAFVDPATGWIMLTDGTVVQTTDGGTEFIQRTAVPGTKAVGGTAAPTAISFLDASTGFATTGAGKLYTTTDAAVSWKLVADTGDRALHDIEFVDAKHGFAVGAKQALIRTEDGGATWVSRDVQAEGRGLEEIDCATPLLCVVTTAGGDQLVRTTDAAETSSLVAASTDPIHAAAFASDRLVSAAGANGATVVSEDAGANFVAVGARLSGEYSSIKAGGQPGTAYAPGDNGALAISTDRGATWARGNVATSENVRDVSFPSAQVGYALDTAGGVFRTQSGGLAWSALDAGASEPPVAIIAPAPETAITIGPRGMRRSTDGGAGWKRVKAPLATRKSAGVAVAQADFVDARRRFVVDSHGFVWRTDDGGRSYRRLHGVGTTVSGIAFASATAGYAVVDRFGDSTEPAGFLLRTTDGGATWRPQFVVKTPIGARGIATSGQTADHLLAGGSSLVSTTTGGDAGTASSLTLATSRRTLRRPGRIKVSGKLAPASGFERVTVSRLRGRAWEHTTVKAASNGSFSTGWRLGKGTYRFVAQWTGDFRSFGAGSKVLTVNVNAPKEKRKRG